MNLEPLALETRRKGQNHGSAPEDLKSAFQKCSCVKRGKGGSKRVVMFQASSPRQCDEIFYLIGTLSPKQGIRNTR